MCVNFHYLPAFQEVRAENFAHTKFLSGLLLECGRAAGQGCISLETSWDSGHHVDHSWVVKRLWGLSVCWSAMQEMMGYNLASLVMGTVTVPGQKHICDSPSSKCLQTQSTLHCAIITQPHVPLPGIPLPSSGLVAMRVSWRQLSSASASLSPPPSPSLLRVPFII